MIYHITVNLLCQWIKYINKVSGPKNILIKISSTISFDRSKHTWDDIIYYFLLSRTGSSLTCDRNEVNWIVCLNIMQWSSCFLTDKPDLRFSFLQFQDDHSPPQGSSDPKVPNDCFGFNDFWSQVCVSPGFCLQPLGHF